MEAALMFYPFFIFHFSSRKTPFPVIFYLLFIILSVVLNFKTLVIAKGSSHVIGEITSKQASFSSVLFV